MYTGIILHLIGKISFVMGSYGMHFFLGRFLTEAQYGMVGTVITIMNFEYIFFTDGVHRGVAKVISTEKYREDNALRTALLFQTVIVAVFFSATFFGASVIGRLLQDESLTGYIRFLSFILPFTGIHSLMLGILNGHKDFASEAGAGIVYPMLKLSVIPIVLFAARDPVSGVQAGYLLAAASMAAITLWRVVVLYRRRADNVGTGIGKENSSSFAVGEGRKEKLSIYEYASITFSYLLLFGASTFMMNLDTLVLKRVSGDNALVGYYTGVANFAKIPYYLLTACYTVALPVITTYYNRGELKEASEKISDILSLILTMIAPVVVVIAAVAPHLLGIFYKTAYSVGGNALTWLIIGIGFLGMLLFFSTVLSSADRRLLMVLVSGGVLVGQVILCSILTRRFSITGTGAAAFFTAGGGMLICGVAAARIFGNFWHRIHSLLGLVNLAAFGLYYYLFRCVINPGGFIMLVVYCGLAFGLLLGVNLLIRLYERKKKNA